MIRFHRGVLRMPLYWQLWLMLLVAANAMVPVYFIRHFEAQVVLATFLLSFVLMTALTARFGFTRIPGLGHILWVPLLVFVAVRLNSPGLNDRLRLWLQCLVGLNSISLFIDVIDVTRYAWGDRSEPANLQPPSS